MMKKQGFTLAEVLITLTIIGVIATMTLPALMTNTAEQQYKSGLKKGINTLTEAAQMHEAIEGFNYASLSGKNAVTTLTTESGKQNSIQSLAGMLKERTKVDIAKTMQGDTPGIEGATDLLTNPQAIYFNDGSALIFGDSAVAEDGKTLYSSHDDMPVGFLAVYDTNGLKGPNQLSNCQGYIF